MGERARLSVVVPTLDEAALLPALLARLLPCDGADDRPDELWLCDGGSRDGTPALARAHGAGLVTAERGRGTQLRRGAQACSGDVLLFLHADCLPLAGALSALRHLLERPQVHWGGLRQEIDAPGAFYRLSEVVARMRVARLGRVYGDCGLFVRRELYESVGGFAALPLFEDLELSRRLRARAPAHLAREARLRVSARRWRREGALRATLRNWIIHAAWSLGVSPQRLVRYYAPRAERVQGGASQP